MEYQIIRNDITLMDTDAIVLPANSKLKEGSGTSRAIYEKAGRKELQEACLRYDTVPVGMSVPTLGFNLEAAYIIHTVVPKWKDGKHDEYALLGSAYLSALRTADELECKSIAFPLLASGNNGFDLKLAFEIADKAIHTYDPKHILNSVYLVVYGMRATEMIKDMGFSVDEKIDQKYVLSHDEGYRKSGEKNKTKSYSKIHAEAISKKFDELAKWISDPKNQQFLLNAGKQVERVAIAAADLVIAIKKR